MRACSPIDVHETLERARLSTAMVRIATFLQALALAVVRILAERFDLLDKRVSDSLAQHADDHPKVTEWSNFRARLFEEPNL